MVAADGGPEAVADEGRGGGIAMAVDSRYGTGFPAGVWNSQKPFTETVADV
jgi:hypothetical protein